jgi:hypothetical protein
MLRKLLAEHNDRIVEKTWTSLRHAGITASTDAVQGKAKAMLINYIQERIEDARRSAALRKGVVEKHVRSLRYCPLVFRNAFVFGLFNPDSVTAGPSIRSYIVVTPGAGGRDMQIEDFPEGLSGEQYSNVLSRAGFSINGEEDAVDAAVLFTFLSNVANADGWCLIADPNVAPSGGTWPRAKLLPEQIRRGAPTLTVELIAGEAKKKGYRVRFTTWTAIGGQVTAWTIDADSTGKVTVCEKNGLGSAFPRAYK